ncbi:hypothetical protein T07_7497 [Trichinella nelsoni]|uniref:Uncharacterized protein n=1 Tax=Trichinella nelsoni TaxID=6336 RepID=A0A0V0RFG6_9BILA|nr:hypothetical protein T07_7497 [Trichinella nelsoni]
MEQLHCTHTAEIFTRTLNYMMFFIKEAFRYIEDRTRLKTGNSHEADPKNEVEASHHCTPLSLTCCIGMPRVHLQHSSLRDLSDKFE